MRVRFQRRSVLFGADETCAMTSTDNERTTNNHGENAIEIWYSDTGSGKHIANSLNGARNAQPHRCKVQGRDENMSYPEARGTLILVFVKDYDDFIRALQQVLHAPIFGYNIRELDNDGDRKLSSACDLESS